MSENMSEKMLRAKDAAAFLGIGVSTLWKWVKDGRLPKGISLGPRCTVWRQSELGSFVADREGESRTKGVA